MFLFVIPGVIAYALAQQGRLTLEAPDQALPTLICDLLPVGLRGLVVAGLLAALMSSLASGLQLLLDAHHHGRLPEAAPRRGGEDRLVLVGQVATVVLVGLGLAWIPLMKHISGQLYQYLQSVQAYIAPPIAAVFLLGIFWRRVNAPGAMAALGTGFVLGIARLVLELNKAWLAEGWLLDLVSMNFLHFAILLFGICCGVLVGVSLSTAPPRPEQVDGLTFGGDAATAEPRGRHHALTVWLSVALLAAVAAVWLAFRG